MSGQRLQVFVSSKMQELAAERDALEAVIAEMEIDAFVFEHDAGAQSQSIQQTFLQSVETSDLYVGLFWKGYGGYTIEAFEYARMLGMDCLIYEKREDEGAGLIYYLDQFVVGCLVREVREHRWGVLPAFSAAVSAAFSMSIYHWGLLILASILRVALFAGVIGNLFFLGSSS